MGWGSPVLFVCLALVVATRAVADGGPHDKAAVADSGSAARSGDSDERYFEACWCEESLDGADFSVNVTLVTLRASGTFRNSYALKPAYSTEKACLESLAGIRANRPPKLECRHDKSVPDVRYRSLRSIMSDDILKRISPAEKRRFVDFLAEQIQSRERFQRYDYVRNARPDYTLDPGPRREQVRRAEAALQSFDRETERLRARKAVIERSLAAE